MYLPNDCQIKLFLQFHTGLPSCLRLWFRVEIRLSGDENQNCLAVFRFQILGLSLVPTAPGAAVFVFKVITGQNTVFLLRRAPFTPAFEDFPEYAASALGAE